MILGVGLAALATLFPIGILRLRDAARYSRTKYLVDSAAADGTARTLFSPNSFGLVDRSTFNMADDMVCHVRWPISGGPVSVCC